MKISVLPDCFCCLAMTLYGITRFQPAFLLLVRVGAGTLGYACVLERRYDMLASGPQAFLKSHAMPLCSVARRFLTWVARM